MEQWKVHSERPLHESDTVRLGLADVELTDGTRIDHYVIRIPFEVVSLVISDAEARVLLLRRYRFITKRWCWDVPAGKVAAGEAPADAAARASVDATGWRPGPGRLLGEHPPPPRTSAHSFGIHLPSAPGRVA